MTDQHSIMTTDEVAEHLGIAPQSVRSTLRRYGISEVRGYDEDAVKALERPGRGARTDLAGRGE
ncbi:hypothetical protein [Pseudonocardia parietis]|uniref:Transcriptional regulator of viral defense system n=1 Tax=Pseudonocardia parietis TaxID=570936 RepID=A0ABS4W1Y9_9PSEU|nr:hypothetical protein [Pseudonocardia parietis]MBP2370189.1 putative transcriptional regulator of viral defense system [Pseudonocardia parietis]